MQTRSRNTFTSIHTEGSLLPVDLLQRVLAGDKDLGGLTPADYHLPGREKLNEAVNRSWNRLQGAWAAFQTSKSRLKEGDPGTTLTRERWLLPLFQELGYGRLVTAKAIEIEGKAYPISHGWANVPLHLVGCGVDLDRRAAGVAGASRSSPHSLVQELLNRADDRQWGIAANGLRLRILRDNASLTRQAYLEFDLEAMFSGDVYADFVLLWLLSHQSRFESADGKTEDPWLEKWAKAAQERGTRALDQLRNGVEEAITALGSGFLSHPSNQELRKKLRSGELDAQDYYRQLLRLVYRMIFLFAAEDRELLLDPGADTTARDRYLRYYSTARLRRLAERQRGGRHSDLWQGLKLVSDLLAGKGQGDSTRNGLGLPILNGFLFSDVALPDLEAGQMDNLALLTAIRSLAFTVEGSSLRAVDYKNLGPEELGSVYESLLELHPRINSEAGTFELSSASGHERKTTGSYYTPTSLIQVLLDSALDPVIEQAVKDAGASSADQQNALLNLKVCDPACGSGHFLIAAAHRIARRLAQIQAGGDEPPPSALRQALRAVIAHCIYGVDVNPMAVELCKVNLWLESIEPGRPLSFLDAHIQCGDSLVGVGPGLDISEIPDEAFKPAFGDDKATATAMRKRNKRERGGQLGFRWKVAELTSAEDLRRWRAERLGQVDSMPEDDPTQVQAKAQAYAGYQESQEYTRNRLEYDLWTAAFFWPIPNGDAEQILAPTQQELIMLRAGNELNKWLLEKVRQISERLSFFHWELVFPHVFSGENGGFNCVVGNPPWETLQLEEQEFFAVRDPEIANLPGELRKRKIATLKKTNPILADLFQDEKHNADAKNKFLRECGRFPLTAIGKLNTYAIFAEHFRTMISGFGRNGVIVPTGIATDFTTRFFFQDIVEKGNLVSLYDFENGKGIFPAVERNVRFCLLTTASQRQEKLEVAAQLISVEMLSRHNRKFSINVSDLNLVNPNTLNCPMFFSEQDAELVVGIHRRAHVLVNKRTETNPWNITLQQGLFNMTSDSGLFKTYEELLNNGFVLYGNRFIKMGSEPILPLFESKLVHQYNHRSATFMGIPALDRFKLHAGTNEPELLDLQKSDFVVIPRYWVSEKHVVNNSKSKRKWFLGFRNAISATADARSLVASIVPFCGIGHSMPIIIVDSGAKDSALLLSILNSIIIDYVLKQKATGGNLTFAILEQLPTLLPDTYNIAGISFIAPRVLELVYTAWDIKAFADDSWMEGGESLQAAFRKQWEHNQAITGGHEWDPPEWAEISEDGIPLPPFKWDEDRRALLRAELDAYYAKLYGLTRDELRYILDPQDVYGPDFPGETFRVLKDKEIRQYGEYRTRRLVLEAWDRLEGVEVGNVDGYKTGSHRQESESAPSREVITIQPEKKEDKPASPPKAASRPAVKEQEENIPAQPSFSDFGLYKCESCGKMVMGFEKEKHAFEAHGGKKVEWKKLR